VTDKNPAGMPAVNPMIIQFTPFIILLLISGTVAAAFTVIGWQNRALPVAKPFILLMGATTVWIFGSAFEMMSTQLPTVLFICDLEYPGIMTVPLAWLLLILALTGRERYLTKKMVALLFVVPVLVCLAVITNPYHMLYYTGFHAVTVDGAVVWIYEHGPLFWIASLYNYSVTMLALVLAVGRFFSSRGFYRRQTILLLCAAFIPIFFNLAYLFHWPPFPEYDLTQIAFLLTAIVLAFGLLRYQLFSAIPVAYSRVFTTIRDGVIVINREFRVIDLNPAAERITGMGSHKAVGRELAGLLPAIRPVLEHPVPPAEEWRTELLLPRDNQPFYYDILVTPLDETGTLSAGYLCILRDVTGRKQAELALVTANRKINLLTSITRHDITNKLMIVHGYIELVRNSPLTPVQQEFLDREEEAVNAMREQIEFTRKYQQLGSEAPVWQRADAVILQAKTQVFFDRVRFSVDVGGIEIFADPMLERVFYNLLDNAVKYGGDRLTAITISTCMDGADLIIAVENDGEAISASDRSRLFERGFGRNTGLGLFLSREILSITDITIELAGSCSNGVRFEIRVPSGKYRSGSSG
jgi:PAS domain S-box-containing protein